MSSPASPSICPPPSRHTPQQAYPDVHALKNAQSLHGTVGVYLYISEPGVETFQPEELLNPSVDEPAIPSPPHFDNSRHTQRGFSDGSISPNSTVAPGDLPITSLVSSDDLSSCETLSKVPENFNFRCASAFFALFTAGWADGMTGTILPHIKSDFNLSYMMSSLLFITSTIGFALGVILIEQVMCLMGSFSLCRLMLRRDSSKLNPRGWKEEKNPTFHANEESKGKSSSPARARFRILVTASAMHASFFILMGTARGFASVLIAYFFASFAKAFLNGKSHLLLMIHELDSLILFAGTVNAYVAASPKRPLGQLYACNAFGAFAAPLVCQTLLARGIPWSHFYLGSLVLSVINTTLLSLAFRPTRNEYIEEGNGVPACVEAPTLRSDKHIANVENEGKASAMPRTDTVLSESPTLWSPPTIVTRKDRSTLRYALTLRYVWAFSLFMWIYSGSETSTQGYMATYLLAVRNANPNTVGYVTSGFWGGMAISRLTTGLVSPYVNFTQRKHSIHIILCVYGLSGV
ncbi:hypothetical protein M0805_008341 [Coniferiporia weirii]|nr:hypothetical protein M0805_008341 [Coniferiporia weirii]